VEGGAWVCRELSGPCSCVPSILLHEVEEEKREKRKKRKRSKKTRKGEKMENF
jgi:hypothetical protein